MTLPIGFGTKTKRYHFRGVFASLVALQAAWPTAISGDRALVDTGAGNNAVPYYWDAEDGWIVGGGGGISYTFGNGLDENAGTVTLGDLTEDTVIDGGGFNLAYDNIGTLGYTVNGNYDVTADGNIQIKSGLATEISHSTFLNSAFSILSNGNVTLSSDTGKQLSLQQENGYLTFNTAIDLVAQGVAINIRSNDLINGYTNSIQYGTDNTIKVDSDAPGFAGLQYTLDFSANYTNRSLPDVAYVNSNFGGNPVDSLVLNPTVAQNGYVLAWNHTNGEYELVPQSGGGGVTFGTSGQIPYMNVGGTDFSYEAGFEYDPTTNTFSTEALNLGISSTAGALRYISAIGSAANIGLYVQSKGTGSIQLVANDTTLSALTGGQFIVGVAGGSQFRILSQSTDVILSPNTVNTEVQIAGGNGGSSNNNASAIYLKGGNAYAPSGNGNGGNCIVQSGQRRTAGSGTDGLIILDPLTRWIEVPNTSGAVTVTAADRAAMYVKDIAAGNAAFHFKTENAQEIKLYQVNAGSAYAVTNGTTDRSYDANATTLDEIADVLGTLITDLKLTGLIA